MNRRTALALAGGSLAAALAGCSGGGETPDETPTPRDTDAPTETVTPEPTPQATDSGTETPGSVEEITGEPTETLEQYVTAIANDDAQTAIGLVHEDGEQTEADVANDLSYFSERSVRLVETGVLDVQEGDVVVRGILEASPEGSDETTRIGIQMLLRRGGPDDEWLIYNARGYRLSDGQGETETEAGGSG